MRKTKKERYSFSDEEKKQILSEIACYFRENHDLELGMIGTGGIFDFFLDVMGDHIYNQALDDANRFFQNYAENMEADFTHCTRMCGKSVQKKAPGNRGFEIIFH